MSIVTLTSPLRTARGRDSIFAGNVLYPLGARQVSRSHVTPSDPLTSSQATVRAAVSQCASALRNTPDQYWPGWVELAAHLTRRDADLDAYTLRPVDAFNSVNTLRLLAGLAVEMTAPPFLSLPEPPDAFSFGISPADGGSFVLELNHDRADGYWLIETSAPLPGLVRKARKRDMRYWSNDLSAAFVPVAPSPQEITMDVADARHSLSPGDRIAVAVTPISPGFIIGRRRRVHLFVQNLTLDPVWTDWLAFGSATSHSPDPGLAWLNPTNCLVEAGYSNYGIELGVAHSEALRVTDLNPSVPADADILEIQIRLRKSDHFDSENLAFDEEMRLIANGDLFSTDKPDPNPWTDEPSDVLYSWSTDASDPMPSVVNVNGSNFGFSLRSLAGALQAGRVHFAEGRVLYQPFA